MRMVKLRFLLEKRAIELVQRLQVILFLYNFSEIEIFIKELFKPVVINIVPACSRNNEASQSHLV